MRVLNSIQGFIYYRTSQNSRSVYVHYKSSRNVYNVYHFPNLFDHGSCYVSESSVDTEQTLGNADFVICSRSWQLAKSKLP